MRARFHKHKIENLIVVPKIVTIHYLEFDKYFTYEGESHDFWELVYADKNNVIITAENDKFVLKEGNLTFHKPNEFHSLSSDSNSPPNVFIITFESKSPAMSFFQNRVLPLPRKLKVFVENIILEARQTFVMDKQNPFITKLNLRKTPALGGSQLIRLNLEQLLIYLIREESKHTESEIFVPREEFESRLVNDIISLLKQRLYSTLTVEEICDTLNYGKTYLYRLFKSETGHSIIHYFLRLKIEEAKKLLRSNKSSLTDLSEQLHFASLSHFCTTFKKFSGMTPTQYLNSVASHKPKDFAIL